MVSKHLLRRRTSRIRRRTLFHEAVVFALGAFASETVEFSSAVVLVQRVAVFIIAPGPNLAADLCLPELAHLPGADRLAPGAVLDEYLFQFLLPLHEPSTRGEVLEGLMYIGGAPT